MLTCMTAELDYAYLAEFAKTEHGTITAVGASFTEVSIGAFPATMRFSVVGRVRRGEDEPLPSIEISMRAPGSEESTIIGFDLTDDHGAVVYDGKIANVFVVNGPVLLEQEGLVEIKIAIDGEVVRRLAFEALLMSNADSV